MMIRIFGAACAALLILAAVAVASPEAAEAQDAALVSDASVTDNAGTGDELAVVYSSKDDADKDLEDWETSEKGSDVTVELRKAKLAKAKKELADATKALVDLESSLKQPKRSDYITDNAYDAAIAKWEAKLTKDDAKKLKDAKNEKAKKQKNVKHKKSQHKIAKQSDENNKKDLKRAQKRNEDHCKGQ